MKILVRNLDGQIAFPFMKDVLCKSENCHGQGFVLEYFGDLHVCESCKGTGLEYQIEDI